MSRLTVGYCRCSDPKQTETSIPQQRELLTAYASQHGMAIERWFIDEGITGTTDKRPAYQELLAEVRAGRIATVLAINSDRFSRQNPGHSLRDLSTLSDANVCLILTQEGGKVDWADDWIWLKLGVEMVKNHGESVKISGRVLRGMASQARQFGTWQGGKPPFGYRLRWDKHPASTKPGKLAAYLEHDPEAAEHVRYIFRQFAAGLSLRRILADLAELAPGRIFTTAGLRRLLSNPRYIHPSVWNVTTESKFHRLAEHTPIRHRSLGQRSRNDQLKWVVGVQSCDPIIDEKTWHTVQVRLKSGMRAASGCSHRSYALRSLCVCHHCGGRLVGHYRQAGSANYYECARSMRDGVWACSGGAVREDYLLAGLGELLRDVIFTAENRERISEFIRSHEASRPQDEAKQREKLIHERRRLDERHAELENYLATATGSDVGLVVASIQRNREKAAQIDKQLSELAGGEQVNFAELERAFWAVGERLGEVLASSDPDRINGALRAVIERIEVAWTSKLKLKRHVKRISEIKVVFADDPILRILLSATHHAACRGSWQGWRWQRCGRVRVPACPAAPPKCC